MSNHVSILTHRTLKKDVSDNKKRRYRGNPLHFALNCLSSKTEFLKKYHWLLQYGASFRWDPMYIYLFTRQFLPRDLGLWPPFLKTFSHELPGLSFTFSSWSSQTFPVSSPPSSQGDFCPLIALYPKRETSKAALMGVTTVEVTQGLRHKSHSTFMKVRKLCREVSI